MESVSKSGRPCRGDGTSQPTPSYGQQCDAHGFSGLLGLGQVGSTRNHAIWFVSFSHVSTSHPTQAGMTLKTRIHFLKRVPSGTRISYGGAFTTKRESMIATLPIGYADGYSRHLSNQGRGINPWEEGARGGKGLHGFHHGGCHQYSKGFQWAMRSF